MDISLEKTLCKQCETCQDFTYQRIITRGKRKGEVWKFKYCGGNADIIKYGNWGPDIAKLKSGDKEYASLTRRRQGRKYHFTAYLKNNPRNYIIHLDDTLDCRMRMLREVSPRCKNQTIKGVESRFPGVGLTSTYRQNPKQSHGKKIWWARINVNGEIRYLDNYYSELEAANAYYSECEKLGLDINKETPEWRIYQKWLQVKEFIDPLVEQILEDYHSQGQVDWTWYTELLFSRLK